MNRTILSSTVLTIKFMWHWTTCAPRFKLTRLYRFTCFCGFQHGGRRFPRWSGRLHLHCKNGEIQTQNKAQQREKEQEMKIKVNLKCKCNGVKSLGVKTTDHWRKLVLFVEIA